MPTAKQKRAAKKKRQSSMRRRQERMKNKGNFLAINIPEGWEPFKPEADETYDIDFLGYIVSDKSFGDEVTDADPGYRSEARAYYKHSNIGPNKKNVVCPLRTFDKPCPICEKRADLLQRYEWNDKKVSALNSSLRLLSIVRVDGEKKLKYYDFAYNKSLGHMMAESCKEGDDLYYELDEDGRTVTIKYIEGTYMNHTFADPFRVDFGSRKTDLPKDIEDRIPCLDDWIPHPTYDELYEMLHQAKPSATATKEKDIENPSDEVDEDDDDTDDDNWEDEENTDEEEENTDEESQDDDDDDTDDEEENWLDE